MVNRNTKYVSAIKSYLNNVGHATNLDILKVLKKTYPKVTATTVHRVTERLVKNNEFKIAPTSLGNSMRFDINNSDHDHFMCHDCERLRDVIIPESIVNSLKELVPGCHIESGLTIMGICSDCLKLNNV